MTPDQKAKVTQFLNDQAMSGVIYDLILRSFLKNNKDRDVQNLAASMIAVEHLEEAWKELARLKNEQRGEQEERTQRGL